MPYAPDHKAKTRTEILHSALRLFNQRGFADVSIDEIMAGAGRTRGGFYAHFRTKDELYAEAVNYFLSDRVADVRDNMPVDLKGMDIVRNILDAYLSQQHFEDVPGSCPMIALPSDIARGGRPVKQAFQQVLEALIGMFENGLSTGENDVEESRRKALALSALCVGGMVLARGVPDAALSASIRDAARETALGLCGREESTRTAGSCS